MSDWCMLAYLCKEEKKRITPLYIRTSSVCIWDTSVVNLVCPNKKAKQKSINMTQEQT